MLADAKDGRINLIEVNLYVEDVRPALGVRFIALMDHTDSENGADILPFGSPLNDCHFIGFMG